jgi:hypothetical protein
MTPRTIIDSNLLTLLVVGTAARSYIAAHKRLAAYTVEDYDLLVGILGNASEVWVTPHVLAETSNLVGYAKEPARTKIYETLRKLAPVLEERQVRSGSSMERREFVRLGLTDCTMLDVNVESTVLLTADLDLYLAASAAGQEARNFHHLRNL